MITAEEARKLQEENYQKVKENKLHLKLDDIENFIIEQSFKEDDFIYYHIIEDDISEKLKSSLTSLGYKLKLIENTKYKISWENDNKN